MQAVQAKHPSARCERAAVELLTCPLGCPCVVQILMTVHLKPSTGHPAIASSSSFLSFFASMATHWQGDGYDRQTERLTTKVTQDWTESKAHVQMSVEMNPDTFSLQSACKTCKSHTMPCAVLIYSLKSKSVLLNCPTCSALAIVTLLVHSPTEYGWRALRFSCSDAKHNSCECLCCTLLRD